MDRAAKLVLLFCLAASAQDAQHDAAGAYERYVKTAPEFQRHDPIDSKRWTTWLYMPWRHRWSIGTDDAAGRFCRQAGINGGFLDYGEGPLAWLEKWRLPFYVDHVAGKGTLFMRQKYRYPAPDVRPVPLDRATIMAAVQRVHKSLAKPRKSPLRVAYALDDEISWGTLVVPLPWKIHASDDPYRKWLKDVYGEDKQPRFVTPEFTRAQLGRPLKAIDFSPLLDRNSFNDSVFANAVGLLVTTANMVDGETPCGFVGGQAPNLWGGYDYAKLLAKTQFIEVYDHGSAPEIVRSMGRGQAVVSTHFRSADPAENSWKAWSRFAHGQRGMIAWVDGKWFAGDFLKKFSPTLHELGKTQGPKMHGARWLHDGIAIYYSHASIQVSWCLDAEPHGKSWNNRNDDHRLGTSHTVRKAWETLLNDAGLQYDFVGYDTVIRDGVPAEYKVLVLPACYALSDVEARRIKEFAARGGRVVADFMCGLFDEHGRGRKKGALDDLFGVTHDGTETRADFFGAELWVEADQDAGYKARRWLDRLGGIPGKMRVGYSTPERRLKSPVVNGNATYLNLSPVRYLLMRAENSARARHRDAFVLATGAKPVVRATGSPHLEVTRWKKGDRTLLFVVQNPVWQADASHTLGKGKTTVDLRFAQTARDVVNERTGEKLGDGDFFRVPFRRAEAVFLSYR